MIFGVGRLEPGRTKCLQNGHMDLESATHELYRLVPTQFTAVRDAKASEARQAGHPDLASSLKKLRKPSVGAWMANLLVLEHSNDVERLIDLGGELRSPRNKPEGQQIRRVSKEKGDAVSKLMREATSKASRMGQPVSVAALQELEATLEAAFADPQAADDLRGGHLSRGLHYSGLGFTGPTQSTSLSRTKSPTSSRTKSPMSPRISRAGPERIAAQRNLDKANREVQRADAALKKARQAVAEAADRLTHLKSAEVLAVRRSKEARDRALAAERKLGKQR